MTPWTSIPGETPIDPSGLKDRSVTTRKELCKIEAENIRKAHVKYLSAPPSKKQIPFDIEWLCKLHRKMFGDVWHWAGQFRQQDLNFGVAWHQISQQVYELTQQLRQWENKNSLLDQVAHLHHRAVQIYPFQNGNGRWARLLANIWQYAHQGGLTFWPEDTINGTTGSARSEYLRAVREADGGEYTLLKSMHQKYTKTW